MVFDSTGLDIGVASERKVVIKCTLSEGMLHFAPNAPCMIKAQQTLKH